VLLVGTAVIAACSSPAQTAETTATTASAATTVATSTTVAPASSTSPAATAVAPPHIVGDLSADQLAAELTTVEQAAANGDASVGERQQLLYRYLSAHPDLDETVIAAVGTDVRPYVERIVRARELGQARAAANPSTTPPSDTLPAWELVDPGTVDQLMSYYHEAEAATGVPWYWLAAIHFQETRMGRIVGTSSAGAVGPMQFLPSTWAKCCDGDPTVAHDAIVGAAKYLVAGGAPTDMPAALHHYNPNDSYVATVTAFAENMRDNPKLYNAYREWQVFYPTSAGTVRLPTGYNESQPIDAATYLADHPEDAAG